MASTTPKTMSSRLATMKFMQRSVAKSANSSPSTPNGPPSKRVRLSNGASAPATPGTPSDAEVLQTALAAEERKREEALERAAEKSGETKWVLSFQAPPQAHIMQVRTAGFAELDADDESDAEEERRPARLQFGGGVPNKAGKPVATERDEDSDDDSSSSSEEYDSDDPTAELIRETKREVAAKEREARRTQKKAENVSPRGAARPLDEDMDLGGLSSISGARRTGPSGGGRDLSNIQCFTCGQTGHMKGNCPKASAPRGSAGRGRGRGRK